MLKQLEIQHLKIFQECYPNETFFVADGHVFKKAHGEIWKKIFYSHYNSSLPNEYFKDEEEVLKANSEHKYSILGELREEKYREGGKYEFLLEYPELSGYNRWKQTDNPTTTPIPENGAKMGGYEALSISWDSNKQYKWGGLGKDLSFPRSLIVGSNDGYWHWAIGIYKAAIGEYSTGFPGPPPYTNLQFVNLWVRAPHEDLATPFFSNIRPQTFQNRKMFLLSFFQIVF